MEIQCVEHSAAMIAENSGVEISPVPAFILPHLLTQQMSIKLPRAGPKGLHRALECQLKLLTSIQLLHIIIEETEGKKNTHSVQVQYSRRREGGGSWKCGV